MEMGGDTHSFRSITYMDDVRVLLRHRGSLVNKRTLRVPRGEEGRREKKGRKKHDSEWGWERVGVRGTNFGFLLGTVMLPGSPAYMSNKKSYKQEEAEKVNWRISHLDPPVGLLKLLCLHQVDEW